MFLMATPIYRICAAMAIMACVLVATIRPGVADQTDPALDQLFEALQSAANPSDAQAIDQEIWRRWTASGNADLDLLMRHGVLAMQSGQLAVAETTFAEIIAIHPRFAEAWNKRATVRYFAGDLRGSIADCGQTLALEARHYGALSGLGLIHLAMDDTTTALQWFERAAEVNPHMAGLQDRISALRKELKGRRI
jgi:tetratricopeptide (TPR) repeat protein